MTTLTLRRIKVHRLVNSQFHREIRQRRSSLDRLQSELTNGWNLAKPPRSTLEERRNNPFAAPVSQLN